MYWHFNLGIFHGVISDTRYWIRFTKWHKQRGICLEKRSLNFSERLGITWFFQLPFGWKLTFFRHNPYFLGRGKVSIKIDNEWKELKNDFKFTLQDIPSKFTTILFSERIKND